MTGRIYYMSEEYGCDGSARGFPFHAANERVWRMATLSESQIGRNRIHYMSGQDMCGVVQ